MHAEPNDWLKELRGDVAGENGRVRVEDYVLRMPGLSVTGDAGMDEDGIRLVTAARVEDSRWLTIMAPEVT